MNTKEIKLLQAQNEALKKQCNNLQQEVKQWKKEYEILDACIELEQGKITELKAENERLKARKDKYYQQTLDNEIQINELLQTLQEIKTIADAPKPFIDFSVIKTAAEVEYDYAAICNELELRLHKVLELITKAEEE